MNIDRAMENRPSSSTVFSDHSGHGDSMTSSQSSNRSNEHRLSSYKEQDYIGLNGIESSSSSAFQAAAPNSSLSLDHIATDLRLGFGPTSPFCANASIPYLSNRPSIESVYYQSQVGPGQSRHPNYPVTSRYNLSPWPASYGFTGNIHCHNDVMVHHPKAAPQMSGRLPSLATVQICDRPRCLKCNWIPKISASNASASNQHFDIKAAGIKTAETYTGLPSKGLNQADDKDLLYRDEVNENFQAIGWPPVRAFRKNNFALHSKIAYVVEESYESEDAVSGLRNPSLFVKVNMHGVPIGRKVNLNAFKGYEELTDALEEMFRRFAYDNHKGTTIPGDDHKGTSTPGVTLQSWLFKGKNYVLIYEDKDADWMLVGDVPWGMFVNSVRRLLIMKAAEVTGLVPR